jgi:UDP-3-O-[3-hydroxymyristoyl] glucosamine N-acyltransferase
MWLKIETIRSWSVDADGWSCGPNGFKLKIAASATIIGEVYFGERASVGKRARVGERARVGQRASVGAGAFVGVGARVGERAFVGARAFVGEGARVGVGAIVGEGAIVGAWAIVGERAIVGEGARVGAWAIVGEGARVGERARVGVWIGSKYQLNPADHNTIAIGCEIKTIAEWRKTYKAEAKRREWSAAAVAEYKAAFELVVKFGMTAYEKPKKKAEAKQ